MMRTLVWLIGWLAPQPARAWAQAMQTEIASIEDARAARRFALGCLWAAVIFRLRATPAATVPEPSAPVVPARLLFVQTNCGCAAAAIGVVYLVVARAPLSLVVVNTIASIMGLLLVGASPRLHRLTPRLATGTTLALSAALLLTALFGDAVGGASRWVQLGPLFVQTSLVAIPVAVLLFAHTVNRWTTSAMVAAAMAVAWQPDRAMAFALCAGLLALLLVRRTFAVGVASGTAAAALLATWLQPDRLPAVPFVDHILWSGFGTHQILGATLWLGSALLFMPMLLMRSADARHLCLACGACWAAIVMAAAVGAYPTPVVGYGGAAILGYFACVAVLGAHTTTTHRKANTGATPRDRRAFEPSDSDLSSIHAHCGG